MKIETDLKTIARLAETRSDENWDFRAFLKTCDLSDAALDAVAHKHYAAVAERIDCRECGNCCRGMYLVLEAEDVSRLADGLEVEPEAVKSSYLAVDEDGDLTMNAQPCPFLAENVCTVYSHRPEVCSSFPHIQNPGFRGRLFGVLNNYARCPIVFNVVERVKAELWKRKQRQRGV